VVSIIPQDHSDFIFKGKQSTIVFQLIRDQSPSDMTLNCRMLESLATALQELQFLIGMVPLEDVPEVPF
jgi:hypothetical protein